MPLAACRACAQPLPLEPLLRYAGMPRVAQHLPRVQDLGGDAGITLEVHQCRACGLVQLANPPVSYHRDVIRATGLSEEMNAFRTAQLGNFLAAHDLGARKVLEVGSGHGEYLAILKGLGVEAHGLEHAPDAVRAASAKGLDVRQGFLGAGEAPCLEGPYAAFFMFSFLEHLPDPGATLRAVAAHLADDAVGLVEVPNFDMILEKDLFAEFVCDHQTYFTRATLRTVLEMNGFELLDCAEVWHRYILSAQVRKRPVLDLSRFAARQSELQAALQACLAACPSGRLAVWGAGHQALALLALADLGGRVRYVVDSAPFKQGCFTPATHIPIVAPDRLREDPVEGVVIMAASYSDEVGRILRREFDPGLQAWILRDQGLEPLR